MLQHRHQHKRGPKTSISDEDLVDRIFQYLCASPFRNQGYRKVWVSLCRAQRVHVSGKRVLRLMRRYGFLQCRRTQPEEAQPRREERPHRGHIITTTPNELWGTDSTVLSGEEGSPRALRMFIVVDHWNSECVGWSITDNETCESGLEPIEMALRRVYGGVTTGVAHGLSLRLDHWDGFLSPSFLQQIALWGIEPSFSFPMQPQTNGVAERFIRTFKEQVPWPQFIGMGNIARSIIGNFVDVYNRLWLVGKLGYRTPLQARGERSFIVAPP